MSLRRNDKMTKRRVNRNKIEDDYEICPFCGGIIEYGGYCGECGENEDANQVGLAKTMDEVKI